MEVPGNPNAGDFFALWVGARLTAGAQRAALYGSGARAKCLFTYYAFTRTSTRRSFAPVPDRPRWLRAGDSRALRSCASNCTCAGQDSAAARGDICPAVRECFAPTHMPSPANAHMDGVHEAIADGKCTREQ